MDAIEALKLTKAAWSENENDWLKYTVGFHKKVEDAAKEGRASVCACILPMMSPGLFDFMIHYFEQQGYFVRMQQVSPSEWALHVDWHIEPTGSRAFKASLEFEKSLL